MKKELIRTIFDMAVNTFNMDINVQVSFFILQLESLSKDDLIKFVKKQMLLLQKERATNEGMFLNT